MAEEMLVLKTSQIKENPAALRTVDRDSLKYKELVYSIGTRGVLQPIRVRPLMNEESGVQMVDEVTGDPIYVVVDGLHRYSASLDSGRATINCVSEETDNFQALEDQIIANAHRVETKPVEFSKGLQRLLQLKPTLTEADLAAQLSKSPEWIKSQLGLLRLIDSAAALVDDSKMNLSAAYQLAKLPAENQAEFIERACVMDTTEFIGLVSNFKKDLERAKREGNKLQGETFTPVARLQNLAAIKEEIANPSVAQAVVNTIPGIDSMSKNEIALASFRVGLEWALNSDPISVAAQRQKFDENQAKIKERRAAASQGKNKQKAEEARLRSERSLVEADALEKGLDVKGVLEKWDSEHHFVKGHYKPPVAEAVSGS